jgi:transposase
MLSWFGHLEPCLVPMEVCSVRYGPHRLHALGHDVRLTPRNSGTLHRTGGTQVKNDALDAKAVREAAIRPHMRCVPMKSPVQQGVLVLHGMYTKWSRNAPPSRTACSARLEYSCRKASTNCARTSSRVSRTATANSRAQLARHSCAGGPNVRPWISKLRGLSHDARVTPCMEICGVGPLTASAMVTSIVDARQFRNARQMAV